MGFWASLGDALRVCLDEVEFNLVATIEKILNIVGCSFDV